MPLQKGAQTLPGFILICFVPVIFYSMGISSWVFNAVTTPIFMVAIAQNIEAVAAGGVPMNIATSEAVFTAALITMGGRGGTLPLNVLMLGSKSKKLKTMGKICIGPSLFNINEPLMFGAPVVFNPLLMVPILINSIGGSGSCMADNALWSFEHSVQDDPGRADSGTILQCHDHGRLESRTGLHPVVCAISADLVSIL